ncbi:WXG100 family type VII secretion target [Plantactinospora solaniradicis]|uniref:WXG100 family type VII secretion target n=1 Tax=Plantactinospora solaniradicis TaxID=1723736 RepID=A0ABW1KE08_9ACTN
MSRGPEQMGPRTDFSRYSHGQLYQMLHYGDEATTRAIADSWDGVGARLHEQASNLEIKLARFRQQWQGGAAEQYQLMISDLSTGLRRIGDAAFAIRDAAHDAGDALVRAKAWMPVPVEVPEVSALTVFLATTPQTVDPLASTQEVAQLRQRQSDAATELARYQQAVQASGAAHARAVAVMNELAVAYQLAEGGIPVPPEATGMPAEGDDASGWEQTDAGTDPEDGTGKPVFGTMFTAGVAAAAAATAGRLGARIVPPVPGWAKNKDADTATSTSSADEQADVDTASSGLGGLGGGGATGVGGGVGGSSQPVAPAAHSGLTGAGSAVGQSAAALRAATGAAGMGAGMMPMMPFMPFAPTGGDMGGSRRTPPWLTETEDVWGESVIITPPVLGEDPPDERQLPMEFPY